MNPSQQNHEVRLGSSQVVFTILKPDGDPYDFSSVATRIEFFLYPDNKGTPADIISGTSGTNAGKVTFILNAAQKNALQILPYQIVKITDSTIISLGKIEVVSQIGIKKITVILMRETVLDLKGPGTRRYFTPEQIDRAINMAVDELYMNDYRLFENTQKITDTLGHYKTRCELTYAANIYLPNDHHFTTSLAGVFSGTEYIMDEIDDSRWLHRKSSKLLPVTNKHPICRTSEKVLQALPDTLESAVVYYLRKPLDSKWGYAIGSDGRTPINDPAISSDVDYPRIGLNTLALKSVEYLGLPQNDQVAMNAENIKNAT